MSADGPLTVGELRAVLDGLDDHTVVTIEIDDDQFEYGDGRLLSWEGVARQAWVRASDAVPEHLGGTNPETEATVGVLYITNTWDPVLAKSIAEARPVGVSEVEPAPVLSGRDLADAMHLVRQQRATEYHDAVVDARAHWKGTLGWFEERTRRTAALPLRHDDSDRSRLANIEIVMCQADIAALEADDARRAQM